MLFLGPIHSKIASKIFFAVVVKLQRNATIETKLPIASSGHSDSQFGCMVLCVIVLFPAYLIKT